MAVAASHNFSGTPRTSFMRTYSTPESALNGEITKLAILECVLAIVLYGAIGLYVGNLGHLALAVALAPLMLFRTEHSSEWGLKAYKSFHDKLDSFPFWAAVLLIIILAPVVGVAIRFVSTIYWAFRRPLHTLEQAPRNWLRQTLCTDLAHPPEIVPLEATKGNHEKWVTFTGFVREIADRRNEPDSMFILFILLIPFYVIGWIPSMFYRISFKATAIAYTPFIWVVHGTMRNPLPLQERLKRITTGELEKVRRGISWVIVASLAAKVGLVTGWVELSYLEEQFPSQRLVQTLVDPGIFGWWQITLGIDAILTFFLLFFADAALARLSIPHLWREKSIGDVLSTVSFLRAISSVITILYFFYLAAVEVANRMFDLPVV